MKVPARVRSARPVTPCRTRRTQDPQGIPLCRPPGGTGRVDLSDLVEHHVLGAPIEVAAIDVDFGARVIRCVDPDTDIPFADVLEPILVVHGDVWRVSLTRASGNGKKVVYLLVTETAPVGPLSGTGIQVEYVEGQPPII